jgi:hypothetical protein
MKVNPLQLQSQQHNQSPQLLLISHYQLQRTIQVCFITTNIPQQLLELDLPILPFAVAHLPSPTPHNTRVVKINQQPLHCQVLTPTMSLHPPLVLLL